MGGHQASSEADRSEFYHAYLDLPTPPETAQAQVRRDNGNRRSVGSGDYHPRRYGDGPRSAVNQD